MDLVSHIILQIYVCVCTYLHVMHMYATLEVHMIYNSLVQELVYHLGQMDPISEFKPWLHSSCCVYQGGGSSNSFSTGSLPVMRKT